MANFSRLKTWIREYLTAADLNAEFNNIINNFTPSGLDDYSANTAQMQSTADPYPGSVESLATSGSGELERLRYLIKQITGEAQWYIDPDLSLATIFSTYTTLANIQANAMNYAVDSGAADAYAAAFTPTITTLTPGMVLVVKTAAANTTTTPTLNVNGLGAVTITRNSGPLLAGDIKANGYSFFQYYTTGWNLVNPILTGTSDIATGAVTSTKASGILGAWDATKADNTVYQATTDLEVHVYLAAGAASSYGYSQGYTDSSNPPTTIRTAGACHDSATIGAGMKYGGFKMSVKKNDYWKVVKTQTAGTVTQTIYAIPVGS